MLFNSFMTEAIIIEKPVHWNQWTGLYMITTSVMIELIVQNKPLLQKTLIWPILGIRKIGLQGVRPIKKIAQ